MCFRIDVSSTELNFRKRGAGKCLGNPKGPQGVKDGSMTVPVPLARLSGEIFFLLERRR